MNNENRDRVRAIRSVRTAVILMPFYLSAVLAIFAVSVVFTVSPDTLQHTPISFETRGLIHHVWHYATVLGSLLVLVGIFWTGPRHLQSELAGLFILMGALVMNLVAVVGFAIQPGDSEEPSGLGMALRAGLITGLAVRAYVIVVEPTVTVAAGRG